MQVWPGNGQWYAGQSAAGAEINDMTSFRQPFECGQKGEAIDDVALPSCVVVAHRGEVELLVRLEQQVKVIGHPANLWLRQFDAQPIQIVINKCR